MSHSGPALRLPLAREAVDRSGVERTDPDLLARLWADPDTAVLRLRGGRVPARDGRIVHVRPAGDLPAHAVFLGRDARARVLVAEDLDGAQPEDPLLGDDVAWLGLRDVAAGLTDADAGEFVTAVAVAAWHGAHPFCSRCGHRTGPTNAGWVRRCDSCGAEHFPRLDPAVIVAVIDEQDRVLLGSNTAWPAGRYSCLAGFVEPGESLEHAVIREVEEESGVVVTDPEYRGSQPWPFPRSLMLGFRARAVPGARLRPDGEEIRSVRWFTRAELAEGARTGEIGLPGAVSIARALLEDWYGGTLPDAQTLIS